MQFWCKKNQNGRQIAIKPPNSAITSKISQSLFLVIFVIMSDNIITALNNNMLSLCVLAE